MKKRIALISILALVVIYLLGPTPETPEYTMELPIVPENLADLSLMVAKAENRPDIKTDNNARIEWANDTIREKTAYALLYLPGYTATRMEGSPTYGNFAKRYGMNTYAARLATQGLDTVDEMINYTPERIWESALRALAIAQKLGDKVLIMSTSTGGTLALKLAAEFPEMVAGIINLSPNIRPRNPEAILLTKPWGLQIAKLVLGGDFRVLERKDTIYEKYWYLKYRVESAVSMENLVETTMHAETFNRVTCPSLTLYYYKDDDHRDEVVSVDRIIWMHELLATPAELKRAIALPEAQTHVIGSGIYSKSIPEVAEACNDFAEEVLQLKPLTLAP
jgi:pimeloyl-ACP methyl ester carboxylesterase